MNKVGESILRGARQAREYAQGARKGHITHVPDNVDVKAIRKKLKLSQTEFSARFGFPVSSLRNWEQGRRHPDVATRAFLLVIDKEPEAVERALTE